MTKMLEARTLPKMELIPPRNAEVDGIFRQPGSPHNGRIIYTEKTVDVEATKNSAYDENGNLRIKKDPVTGKERWKRAPNGEPLYPMIHKEVKFKTQRFILQGNEVSRSVKKVYNFEPTQAELDELERREKEQHFLRDFVASAVEAGLTPGEVIQQIKLDTLGPDEDPDAVDLDVTEEVVAEAMAEFDELEMLERDDDAEDEVAVEPGTIATKELDA